MSTTPAIATEIELEEVEVPEHSESIPFTIESSSIHYIDLDENKIEKLNKTTDDLESYITATISQILDNKNKKEYEFIESSTTEYLINSINKAPDDSDEFIKISEILVQKLVRTELETENKTKNMNQLLTRGSLLQAVVTQGNISFYLVSKILHNKYIDESDLTEHFGLPYKDQSIKSALFCSVDNEIVNIYTFDPHTTIYWSTKFLELEELRANGHNTKMAVDHYTKIIDTYKTKHPNDYRNLRDITIGYFKSSESFNIGDLYSMFENYAPEDPSFDKNKFVLKTQNIPTGNKKFDAQFQIDKKQVSKRITSEYKLSNSLAIKITGEFSDQRGIITSDKDGERTFVKIYTDESTILTMINTLNKGE